MDIFHSVQLQEMIQMLVGLLQPLEVTWAAWTTCTFQNWIFILVG